MNVNLAAADLTAKTNILTLHDVEGQNWFFKIRQCQNLHFKKNFDPPRSERVEVLASFILDRTFYVTFNSYLCTLGEAQA